MPAREATGGVRRPPGAGTVSVVHFNAPSSACRGAGRLRSRSNLRRTASLAALKAAAATAAARACAVGGRLLLEADGVAPRFGVLPPPPPPSATTRQSLCRRARAGRAVRPRAETAGRTVQPVCTEIKGESECKEDGLGISRLQSREQGAATSRRPYSQPTARGRRQATLAPNAGSLPCVPPPQFPKPQQRPHPPPSPHLHRRWPQIHHCPFPIFPDFVSTGTDSRHRRRHGHLRRLEVVQAQPKLAQHRVPQVFELSANPAHPALTHTQAAF